MLLMLLLLLLLASYIFNCACPHCEKVWAPVCESRPYMHAPLLSDAVMRELAQHLAQHFALLPLQDLLQCTVQIEQQLQHWLEHLPAQAQLQLQEKQQQLQSRMRAGVSEMYCVVAHEIGARPCVSFADSDSDDDCGSGGGCEERDLRWPSAVIHSGGICKVKALYIHCLLLLVHVALQESAVP